MLGHEYSEPLVVVRQTGAPVYRAAACGMVVGVALSVLLMGFVSLIGFVSLTSSVQPSFALTDMKVAAPRGSPPHKFAAEFVTPRQLQLERGACWLFALATVLEHTYRAQGVSLGYLRPETYLRLSEQQIGAVMTTACKDNPVCETGDDDLAFTGESTEGGEVEWIYYLQKSVGRTAAVPWSACPYISKPTSDGNCGGVGSDKARAASPLEFIIRTIEVHLGEMEIKRALLQSQRVLSLSLALFGQTYLLPCTAATQDYYSCDPAGAECLPCPFEARFAGVSCCIEQSRFGTSMRGEFTWGWQGQPIVKAGGHAIGLVGYTDTFPTLHAGTGGFIVKNSWWDGIPPIGMTCKDTTAPCAAGRGSHSIGYFLQLHTEIAERQICPNVHSPESWYPCASLAACTAEGARMSARAMRKVLRLQCLDRSPYVRGLCSAGDRYYLKSITAFGAGLSVGCFVAAGGGELCTPPLWVEDLALLFEPVDEEKTANDPDQCGFYLLPYEVHRKVVASFGGTWATDLDVEWSEASYAAAPAHKRDAAKNYTMLSADTLVQRRSSFSGPFPGLQTVVEV